jgi:hypothetical protein
MDSFVQFVAGVAANQQGNKGTNLGMDKLRCHPVQAFIHCPRVQMFVELLVDPAGHVQEVPVDLGSALAGVRR